ncbi:receptor-like protein Cf-9 homolog [Cynara cardunculus var. scolymus]|uniref:receptor-like protein Cf-9 homolog n=1 Tax=Cynara cardunculus var. scolymus TaxID=59895 RepID=UPI000D62EA5A|nr:receptor-like protein Cf-9 homolog [Cynara cardunculus var. scolymus]XP_024967010.1 receptor-like protein Cf-9 homolog [Cynara cardunculus var. scolymus]
MNWNTSTDCCNWDGVTCDHFTNDVIALDLSCGMLRGTIHPNSTLFNLHHLQTLNLAFNNLTNSQLPREIGRFSNSLTHINISHTGFIGQVPTDIIILRKLVSLDLSWNDLKLEPHVFYNLLCSSTSLEELSLDGVNISSILPTYVNLSSMKSLHLSDTGLQGKLPDNIFNLPYLEELDLSSNDDLTGRFPKIYTSTSNPLKLLDLSNINLSGVIPDIIGHLKSLTYLDLSNTNLLGQIPDSIGHLQSLTYLDLSSTNLSGEIPMSIGHLKYLKYLILSNTNLSGEIPDTIGHLKSLTYLSLSNTKLAGEIPDSIGDLKSLYYLDMHSNLIQGPFPPSICNISYLSYLDMSDNRFDGEIPQCLGNSSSNLLMVDLGNNNFHGIIPNTWDDCGVLLGLILNGNSLEGEVPSGLSKCESLRVLDLGNNHLNGTFPHWSANLQHLQVLVLKSNKLHGPIETSSIIKHPFASLEVLDLSQNKFVGHLPRKYFQNFDAMKNRVKNGTEMFSTQEYLTIGKFYSVTVAVKGSELSFQKISVDYNIVDLSSNIFEGEIPEVISSLNYLIVLNLSRNNLNGRIPYALGNLLKIESLDLSCNQLKGEIPQSLTHITSLEVLNVSRNHLVGPIPDGTQFKTFEATSFEGNPGLCGFPLPKCEHRSARQLEVDGEEESGFTWKVVMLGYGCGTLLGFGMGYMMLSTGRPKWFNLIADEIEYMILRRRKKRRHVYIGK